MPLRRLLPALLLALLCPASLLGCDAGTGAAGPGASAVATPLAAVSSPPGAPGALGSGDQGPLASTSPAPEPDVPAAASDAPEASVDPHALLCGRIVAVQARLADLQAVDLRPTAKVTLDIQLGNVDSAFSELRQTDLGTDADTLATPLRKLGYRLDEVSLGVEDFQTSPRPREAADHVDRAATAMADALAGFYLLAGC